MPERQKTLAIRREREVRGENFPDNRNVYRKIKVELLKLQLNTQTHTFRKYETTM